MATEIPNVTWEISCSETRVDKQGVRSSVDQGAFWEIIGTDVGAEGAVTPFKGFELGDQFDLGDSTGSANSNHDERSRLLDARPVHLRMGATDYAYGYVLRYTRKANPELSDIFLRLWRSDTASWYPNADRAVLIHDGASGAGIPSTYEMGVTTYGRFLYVTVQSPTGTEDPLVWYFDTTGTAVTATTRVTKPMGPGQRPKMFTQANGNTPLSVNSLTQAGVTYPAIGQVNLTDALPRGTSTTALQVWLPVDAHGLTAAGDYTGSTAPPSGTTGNCAFLIGTDIPDDDFGENMFAGDFVTLLPGSYAFAYQLVDSKSGRRSAISDIVYVTSSDFAETVSTDPETYVARQKQAYIEIVYNSNLYDRAIIYRSVRVEGVGGSYQAGILHTDRIIDLVNFQTCAQPTAPNAHVKRAVYFYRFGDQALVYRPTWDDRELFDAEVPAAGEIAMWGKTMLASNIRGPLAAGGRAADLMPATLMGQLGETRYSSLYQESPELFPPMNKLVPSTPGNSVIRWVTLDNQMVGFSRDRQYWLYRDEQLDIQWVEKHVGFGTVSKNACEVVGTLCYFLNDKGMKAVDVNGQVDDVRSYNSLYIGPWADDLNYVSMGYDVLKGTLYVFNSAHKHVVQYNFNTASTGELLDVPCRIVRSGKWPGNTGPDSDYALGPSAAAVKPLTQRALFFQDTTLRVSGSFNDRPKHCRVWLPRVDASLLGYYVGSTDELNASPLTLGTNGTASGGQVPVTVPDAPTGTWNTFNGWTMYSDGAPDGGEIRKLIYVDGTASGADWIGTWRYDDTGTWVSWSSQNLTLGLLGGIYTRVMSRPLMPQAEQGQVFDTGYSRVRKVDSIGALFTGVTALGKYRGVVAIGNATEYLHGSFPTDRSGTVLDGSIRDANNPVEWNFSRFGTGGAGTRHGVQALIISPGVEMCTLGMSYDLVSFTVRGSVLASSLSSSI
jgi:hypothetical protein